MIIENVTTIGTITISVTKHHDISGNWLQIKPQWSTLTTTLYGHNLSVEGI